MMNSNPPRAGRLALLVTIAALAANACGSEGNQVTIEHPTNSSPSATNANEPTTSEAPVRADDIPVAFTPVGGWTQTWPDAILATCTEPLVEGAPDLRGLWKVIEVTDDAGAVLGEHNALGHLQRIEQCGNRLVVTASGVIHDMRCDGTEANGVHDVAEFDKQTRIDVVASYEDGVHVLRPVGLPIEVKRWRDGEHAVWKYLGFTARMELVGPPETDPGTLKEA
jgi:hypothetical protein